MSMRQSKYQTSMQILATISDGNTSLVEIMETTYVNKKKAREIVGQLVQQGFLSQGYNERGQKTDTFEMTKKGNKTLKEFKKVEELLKVHAPEMLMAKKERA
jgi:predicted transcriptional regulator